MGKWFAVLNTDNPFFHYFGINEFRSRCKRYSRAEVSGSEDSDHPFIGQSCGECKVED